MMETAIERCSVTIVKKATRQGSAIMSWGARHGDSHIHLFLLQLLLWCVLFLGPTKMTY